LWGIHLKGQDKKRIIGNQDEFARVLKNFSRVVREQGREQLFADFEVDPEPLACLSAPSRIFVSIRSPGPPKKHTPVSSSTQEIFSFRSNSRVGALSCLTAIKGAFHFWLEIF
jgi:hypothetical protein